MNVTQNISLEICGIQCQHTLKKFQDIKDFIPKLNESRQNPTISLAVYSTQFISQYLE